MTSKFANNFQFNKYGVVYYLEVNREGQPVQGQVPLTYQVYAGDGNETLAYDGSNVLVLDTDLSGGALTIDFSAMNNWFGRSIQFIANTALLNDCTLDFGAGTIYEPPFVGSSNTKVFDAAQTPVTTQLYFINPTTAVMTNNPITDPSNIAAGANGDYLQTIGGLVEWAPPSFSPSVISPGLANQIFHTDQTGTVAEWASNIEVPGDLKINGDTDIVSDLQFNGSSGTSGQYLVKTGAATQSWQNLSVSTNSITAGADYAVLTSAGGSALWITPPVVNQIKYGTTFLAQNINAAAGPTALQFSTSTFINSAISNVGVPVNITQPSATEFTIGTSSVYNIDITGYTVPGWTPDGLGGSVVTLSLEVAGTEKTDYCIVCSGDYSFSGRFPAVLITAGQNIRVLARRVVGTAALTTFANGLPAPSFASSILISSAS